MCGTLHEVDAPLTLIGHAIFFDQLTILFDGVAEEIAGEVCWVTSLNDAIQPGPSKERFSRRGNGRSYSRQ